MSAQVVALKNKAPLRPMPPAVCKRSLKLAEEILEAVRSGEVRGLAVVVSIKPRYFYSAAAGWLEDNPIEARGMLASLDDQLAKAARDLLDCD